MACRARGGSVGEDVERVEPLEHGEKSGPNLLPPLGSTLEIEMGHL